MQLVLMRYFATEKGVYPAAFPILTGLQILAFVSLPGKFLRDTLHNSRKAGLWQCNVKIFAKNPSICLDQYIEFTAFLYSRAVLRMEHNPL